MSLTLALVAIVFSLVVPGPGAAAVGPAPSPPITELGPAPTGGFSINLYEKGDFTSQYTRYWCIGASMQMMLSVVGVTDDTTRTAQERYMRVARAAGPSRSPGDNELGAGESVGDLRGAGSGGWAKGLVELGAGRYDERPVDGYAAAVRTAAYALRTTGRPVGLIVWRGAHAWVMTGFTATVDPLRSRNYRVTGVYVLDSWYPRVSSIWGPGQKPNTWISVTALKSDFLPRRAGRWHAEMAGKFVLVLPVDPVSAPQRRRML